MFRKRILAIFAVVTLFATANVRAANKTFTESGQILPGEEWNTLEIYNDETVVDMLGGLVDQMQAYDASTLDMTGGEIYSLYLREFSNATFSGGSVGAVFTWDHAVTNLVDGGTVFSLNPGYDFGTVNMLGGVTEYLRVGESGVANLRGGVINNCLDAWDSATVNIYGYGFAYNPSAGIWDGGQLTGFWLDNTAFAMDLYDLDTYDHINLIPEPSSLILFTGAIFLLRTRKTNRFCGRS